MLSLSDPRWGQLSGNYNNGEQSAHLLQEAEDGVPLEDWYDDLFQELCHQYTVSTAAYAALPHMVRLAARSQNVRMHLLILAGACYGFAQTPGTPPPPPDLVDDWHAAAREAIPLLGELLSAPQPCGPELRYLLSSMAALNGQFALAEAIEALDVDLECPNCGTPVRSGV